MGVSCVTRQEAETLGKDTKEKREKKRERRRASEDHRDEAEVVQRKTKFLSLLFFSSKIRFLPPLIRHFKDDCYRREDTEKAGKTDRTWGSVAVPKRR